MSSRGEEIRTKNSKTLKRLIEKLGIFIHSNDQVVKHKLHQKHMQRVSINNSVCYALVLEVM